MARIPLEIGPCMGCGATAVVDIDPDDIVRWQNGELIQRCLPYLSPGERELLISGTCSRCFDRATRDEEPQSRWGRYE